MLQTEIRNKLQRHLLQTQAREITLPNQQLLEPTLRQFPSQSKSQQVLVYIHF